MKIDYKTQTFTREEIGTPRWIETAKWCNEQGIVDNKGWYIESQEDGTLKVVQYTILAPSKEEQIGELKSFLQATDNYALRLASGEAKEDEYSKTYDCTFKELMTKRAETRAKIKELEDND